VRLVPPPKLCRCGTTVRLVRDRQDTIVVEQDPVPGGPLIVNVDTVVARQGTGAQGLGFQVHHAGWTCRG
jgi:hypothetical protein